MGAFSLIVVINLLNRREIMDPDLQAQMRIGCDQLRTGNFEEAEQLLFDVCEKCVAKYGYLSKHCVEPYYWMGVALLDCYLEVDSGHGTSESLPQDPHDNPEVEGRLITDETTSAKWDKVGEGEQLRSKNLNVCNDEKNDQVPDTHERPCRKQPSTSDQNFLDSMAESERLLKEIENFEEEIESGPTCSKRQKVMDVAGANADKSELEQSSGIDSESEGSEECETASESNSSEASERDQELQTGEDQSNLNEALEYFQKVEFILDQASEESNNGSYTHQDSIPVSTLNFSKQKLLINCLLRMTEVFKILKQQENVESAIEKCISLIESIPEGNENELHRLYAEAFFTAGKFAVQQNEAEKAKDFFNRCEEKLKGRLNLISKDSCLTDSEKETEISEINYLCANVQAESELLALNTNE